jgi:hypothetical protein
MQYPLQPESKSVEELDNGAPPVATAKFYVLKENKAEKIP